MWVEACRGGQPFNGARQLLAAQLVTRDVDPHVRGAVAEAALPVCCLGHCGLEDPVPDRDDEMGSLRDVEELRGRE